MIEYTPEWANLFLWAAILGFILAFLVAFGMGANDCANSYGTVVGSGVLKLWQAYVMATVFESLGAVLLGYKVTDTMRKSIVNVTIYDVHSQYDDNTSSYRLVDAGNCNKTLNCSTYTGGDFIVGEVGALAGTAFWLIVATIFHFPVSTTHSAVGATVGFSLVLKGANGINWWTIMNIAISWVVSPAMAGAVSVMFYLFIKYTCLKRDNPFDASVKMLPIFYWFALTVNLFSVLYGGSKHLKFDKLAWWVCILISFAIGSAVALFMRLWGRELIRRSVLKTMGKKQAADGNGPAKEMEELKELKVVIEEDGVSKGSNESFPLAKRGTDSGVGFTPLHLSSDPTAFPSMNTVATGESKSASSALLGNSRNGTKVATPKTQDTVKPSMVDANCLQAKLKALKHPVKENPLANEVFNYLQIMSACFLSFSHGSNDTANAVGPLVGLWLSYKDGNALKDVGSDATLEYIILFGAAGMIIGLWVLGHKVIETIGSKIVDVTPPSGFAMELGTAFTVLIASKIGIPVSTTHCAVGAVVSVGWMKSHKGGVSWKTFRNIAIAWIVTLPVAGAVSAFVAFLLNRFLVQA